MDNIAALVYLQGSAFYSLHCVADICDPPYPLQQLRRTCVAIAFPRTAAAAERENWHARFKRNRNPNISTDWARLNGTRLWRCNAARHIHRYAIEAVVATYWAFNQKHHTMTHMFWRCAYWFYYLTHPTALDPKMDQKFSHFNPWL